MNTNFSPLPATLSISCVIYDTSLEIIERTLISLAEALNQAKATGIVTSSELHLINNNPNKESFFFTLVTNYAEKFDHLVAHTGHGNIGYGKANNIAIYSSTQNYHLILNPDVELASDSISIAINYMESNKDVGMVAPNARNQFGEVEYLAKRFPSTLVILLRGLNNQLLNRIFQEQLNSYAYKDKIPSSQPLEVELASGCFMLCRSKILQLVNGFSSEYFLYFEDFDLSRKIKKNAKIIFLPNLHIIHHGGNASQKSLKHILLFFKSFLLFLKNNRK